MADEQTMEQRKRSRKWKTAKWGMVLSSVLVANFAVQSWVQPDFDDQTWWVAVGLVASVIALYGGANALASMAANGKPDA